MSTTTRTPDESASARPEVVRRLLNSEPFTRSRRLAERLDADAVLLDELLTLVRLRQVEGDVHLAPLADLIGEAVEWLSGAAFGAGDSAGLTARRRMSIAALIYLVDFNDVIPDDVVGGTVDDHVVLDVVLSRALDRSRD